jgi:mannitol/fructose-specific phosphotransferase system IIA component (Ntr-type)
MPTLEGIAAAVPSATLAVYTRSSLIVPSLQAHDTAGIIAELSQALQRQGVVGDMLPFYHAALNQELLSSSALECGIATPHARLSGVKHLRFAFGRTAEPVAWASKGSWPIRFVFLLAVPATDAASYLHLLASLARLGQQPGELAQLSTAEGADGILKALRRTRVRQA